jgi:hypothetical protein
MGAFSIAPVVLTPEKEAAAGTVEVAVVSSNYPKSGASANVILVIFVFFFSCLASAACVDYSDSDQPMRLCRCITSAEAIGEKYAVE